MGPAGPFCVHMSVVVPSRRNVLKCYVCVQLLKCYVCQVAATAEMLRVPENHRNW